MNIRQWQARERLEAARLNDLVNAINSGLPVTGGTGLSSNTVPNGGTVVSLAGRQDGFLNVLVGKVWLEGPDSEDDFTDYRYWILIQENRTTAATLDLNQTVDLQDYPDSGAEGLPKIVAAINLYEYVDQTHNLKENDQVILLPVRVDKPGEADIPPLTRYLCVPGTGALSKGQYQHMNYTMVSQNQSGWDFMRAHPTLP